MADAFIKLFRKMLKWEWYDDTNTKILFLHCLLKANWEKTKWHGIDIEPGQFITSLPKLADELHLTIHQVRVALEHLKMTGEVADKGQTKFRIITVNNWNEYQTSGRQNGRQVADKRQTSGRQVAAVKEYKEEKEEEEVKELKHIYGEYKHVRLSDKEMDRLVNDYGESETHEAIKYLDEYKQRKGYTSKDDNLTIRKWVFDAVRREKGQNPQSQSLAEKWGLSNDA